MGDSIAKYLKKENLQSFTAWSIYFFINIIFCVKYNPVSAIEPLYIIVIYPLIVYAIYKITSYKNIQQQNYFFILISILILAAVVFLMNYLDKYSIKVDRWSALSFWSESLKNGIFPYSTYTHLGNAATPSPVWQLFHFPFHLLGDTFYGDIFCLIVFWVFLFFNRRKLNIGAFILLLALSPCFWWEMAVRSDLLCNMLLAYVFLSSLFYYSKFWNKHIYLAGLIVGLFLCTKMLVAIPLFLYFFPKFLTFKTKEKLIFAAIVIVAAIVPFMPFMIGESSILNHPEYNPMMTQSRQGSVWVVLVGAILIIFSSLKWKTMRDCFFLSGVFLFLLILTVGIRIMLNYDFHFIIFEDEFDKSYFNVSIPFFLFCICEIRKSRLKGI